MYAPKSFEWMRRSLRRLYKHDRTLIRIFDHSVYPAGHFNIGDPSVTFRHVDHCNAAGTLCHVHSFGDFDPKLGGHLVLFDLRIVVEFPPGCDALIPSASLAHGNTAVQPGEKRYSFTQFCAGGLLRYVRYGFRREYELTEREYKRIVGEGNSRWKKILTMFSRSSELSWDRKKYLL